MSLAFFALVLVAAVAAAEPRLVSYGWGTPDTAWVRAHWREMERLPFDGTGIAVAVHRRAWAAGDTSTRNAFGWHVFGPTAFRPAAFAAAAEDLRAPRWERVRHDFLAVAVSSVVADRGFSWLDDRRWRSVRGNWKVALGLARRGRLRGLLLDPEHYGARYFHHPTMAGRAAASFDAYRAAVRARGRDLGAVAARILPGATVLALYGHTLALDDQRRGALPTAEYGLYPAFLDGLLEGGAERLTLVDGYEFAYGFRAPAEFEAARRAITVDAVALSAVPDRYRAGVRVGFGLWLDRGGAWSTTDLADNYFSPDALRTALAAALATTDAYVWLYSQQPRFFPPRDVPSAYLDVIAAAQGFPGYPPDPPGEHTPAGGRESDRCLVPPFP
jgi:hypothetical protein